MANVSHVSVPDLQDGGFKLNEDGSVTFNTELSSDATEFLLEKAKKRKSLNTQKLLFQAKENENIWDVLVAYELHELLKEYIDGLNKLDKLQKQMESKNE